ARRPRRARGSRAPPAPPASSSHPRTDCDTVIVTLSTCGGGCGISRSRGCSARQLSRGARRESSAEVLSEEAQLSRDVEGAAALVLVVVVDLDLLWPRVVVVRREDRRRRTDGIQQADAEQRRCVRPGGEAHSVEIGQCAEHVL